MEKIITILSLTFSLNVIGQVCFAPANNFAVGSHPRSVISADFNGDGKSDLAIANTYSNSLSVLLGTGTGSFGTATNFAVGSYPESVTSGDFNGDGKADLAVANRSSNTVSVLLGTGTGNFGYSSNLAVGNGPISVITRDFNGDGKADLVTANQVHTLSVLLGTGTGSFATATNIAVGSAPKALISADFNGDGKADLATANQLLNTISVLLGTGTGSFSAASNFSVGNNPYDLFSADFNGDGKADLVTANYASNNVSVLLGTGTGSFGTPTNIALGSMTFSVISADFNGDGKADLAVNSFYTEHVKVLLGTGTGNFGAANNFAVGYGPHDLVSSDFNGDGKVDLAVTNTYKLIGSTYLHSLGVSILLNMPTAISGTASICAGNSTNLTASGASTYIWSTNAGSVTTATVSVSPATTTTYTVTANNLSGCTATKTITVNPLPTVTANASATAVWAGNPVTLTGSGTATTYTWTGGVTNGVPFVPTSTQTYTVTGTNGNGCTKTATVLVTVNNPCNIPFNYIVPVGGTTTSALFGGATTIANKNISILGPLMVDNNIILSGCNVVLNPNVKISLTTGNLTLSNQTHLCACSNMWDGIYVPNGRTLTTSGSTLIEDALRAVRVNAGGIANIDQTIFNRNLIAIELGANYTATSPINLTGSVITSRAIPLYILPSSNPSVAAVLTNITGAAPYIPSVLKAPYTNRKGCYGIDATDVNRLDVGIALAGKSNYFNSIMCGINLTRSNANIYNNQFQNLLGYGGVACQVGQPCYYANGFGVQAYGSSNGTNAITIGGSAPNQSNNFLNTYRAISVSDYKISTIINNSIDNLSTGPFTMSQLNYGNVGVYVKPASNNTITINDQSLIKNCETGVWVNRNYISAISTNVLQINNNTLITSNSSGYCNNGIYVTDLLAIGTYNPTKWEIAGNIITETKNCIFLSNVKKPGNAPAGFTYSVTNNSCMIRYATTGALSGIKAIGCQGINISNNRTKYNVGSSAYTSTGNILAYGIYLQNSSNMGVNCNKIDNAARSMVFDGNCTSYTQNNLAGKNIGITQNTMHNAQDGLVLLTAGTSIGRQGIPGMPSNNYWDLTSVFSKSHTFSNATGTNASSQLCVNNITSGANATKPTINLGAFPFGGGIYAVLGTPPVCGAVPALIVNPDNSDERSAATGYGGYLKMFIEDTIPIVQYNDETHWQREKFVFDEIKKHPSLSDNDDLQNFYTKHLDGALGMFSQVDDNITIGQYELANSINSSINASNSMEHNQKTINSYILKSLLDPAYVYTKSEIGSLTSITYQCALKGGNAVYQARNLLMSVEDRVIEFVDYCEDNGSLSTGIIDSYEKNISFKLYPNPNNGNMVIDYSLNALDRAELLIYDIRGKLISSYQLNSSANSLAISDEQLNNGIYFYKVKVNSCLVKNDKFIIIK